MDDAGRQAARVRAAERDDFKRLTERQQRRHEARSIAPDTGSRRHERASIDADAKQVYRISM